jgi:hypothetical protein
MILSIVIIILSIMRSKAFGRAPCDSRRHPVTVSDTKVRKGNGRVPARPAAMPPVSRQSSPLTYRGYPVQELCWRHSFEEVAFLLWHGELTAHPAGQPGVNGIIAPRASYDGHRAGHLAGEG